MKFLVVRCCIAATLHCFKQFVLFCHKVDSVSTSTRWTAVSFIKLALIVTLCVVRAHRNKIMIWIISSFSLVLACLSDFVGDLPILAFSRNTLYCAYFSTRKFLCCFLPLPWVFLSLCLSVFPSSHCLSKFLLPVLLRHIWISLFIHPLSLDTIKTVSCLPWIHDN